MFVVGAASAVTCYSWTRKRSLRMRSLPSFRSIDYQAQGVQCTNSGNRQIRSKSCCQKTHLHTAMCAKQIGG